MRKTTLLFVGLGLAVVLSAEDSVDKASLATFLAARAADITTSYIHSRDPRVYETNPLVLGLHDGRFTARTVAVQAGVTAGFVAAQVLICRKYPGARKVFRVVNFSMAAAHGYAAATNIHEMKR